ncbi:tetratricopeptide repeat protein [Roseivirga sp. BDSF3-8]|uniref:tetratricopeptide repeat protein n=1 Tax=Roseivirga sp. BDSF3-8 TaxID=3241598 RepID=UPI0035324D34
MSDMPRLQQLLGFLKEEPDDPFLLYAIATEYNGTDTQKALHYYERLLQEHPDYVGTYYHAAALYADIGEQEKAEAIYTKGIKTAGKAGDLKALQELQNAYTNFQMEWD